MALHHIKDDNKCEGPSFIEGDVQDTQKEPWPSIIMVRTLWNYHIIVTSIEELCKVHDIYVDSIKVGCNNEWALHVFDLKYVFEPHQQLSCGQGAGWKAIKTTNAMITLTIGWALLNINMDHLMKEYWNYTKGLQPEARPEHYSCKGWSLHTEGEKWQHL
jgi:hypothetical protein